MKASWLKCSMGALVAGLVTACTVGPDYEVPRIELPTAFEAPLAPTPEGTSLSAWWELLEDPVLSGLVARTLDGNLDYAQGLARIRAARAALVVAGAARLPQLTGSGGAEGSRRSNETAGAIPPERQETFYDAGLDVRWEIDLFGGIARGIEAQRATYQGEVDRLNGVRVSLVAEMARLYVNYRLTERRLDIARRNLEAQGRTLEVVKARVQSGLVPELDLHQAERNVATTGSEIPSLEALLGDLRFAMATLVGETASGWRVPAPSSARGAIPSLRVTPGTGVPADLLRRRPDIRVAERTLAAATARIGVARAELYPKLSLFGSLSLEAEYPSRIPNFSAAAWRFGPRIDWNIFNSGRVRGRIAQEIALAEEARLAWEAAVLTAVEEVESSTLGVAKERERRGRLQRAVDAARRSVELSRAAYEEGLVDFQNVLDNERTLLELQDGLARNEAAITSSWIRVFKALGGGWEPPISRPDVTEANLEAGRANEKS